MRDAGAGRRQVDEYDVAELVLRVVRNANRANSLL